MKQPELGMKLQELRSEKGMTQEQLAEYCEVSVRTIQRIENGEVDPRPFTRNNLSNILEFDFNIQNGKKDDFWIVILHLTSMFCILLLPLVIWAWKRKTNSKIDDHGKKVLNFQITMTLALVSFTILLIAAPFTFLIDNPALDPIRLTGLILLIVPLICIGFFCTYHGIKNAIRAVNGKATHYPLSISFLK